MRTTLKRGIGRGAVLNGNGRAVLPPAPATAMTRYRQPPPSKPRGWRLVGRIVFSLLALALMLAGGAAGGAYLWAHETVAKTAPHSRDVKNAAPHLTKHIPPPNEPAVALVIGSDHRFADGRVRTRSDTIMLIRADPETDTVSTLSFPRDLVVPIHCPGHYVTEDRINTAYVLCGSTGVVETVKALTGLPIHYLVKVNFKAFRQVVDVLGGVWVDVDRRYFNDNSGLVEGVNTYAAINLRPGYQRLTGSQALDFVRYRHADSDLYRNARQQLFVRAMKDQFSGFGIRRAFRVVGAVTRNTEIAPRISVGKARSYANMARGLPSGHVFQVKLQNLSQCGEAGAELCSSGSSVSEAVEEFVNPDVEAADRATASLGIKRRRVHRAPPPSRTSVLVLNGSGVTNVAHDTSAQLAARGYRTKEPPSGLEANAPRTDYERSRVYFDPRRLRSEEAARALARIVGDAAVGPIPLDVALLANHAMLVVVVGRSFDGLAPIPPDRTPERRPPAVRNDPGTSLGLLRPARRHVRFPLYYPTALEERSAPASDLPVRWYTIAGRHRAVRLTFQTPSYCASAGLACEYWGIQETDWPDAPVLAGANFVHRIKGRTYRFYYSGAHLHMIVLQERGATYWVVNTLLDSLSNETMLTIAKSLRPLRK